MEQNKPDIKSTDFALPSENISSNYGISSNNIQYPEIQGAYRRNPNNQERFYHQNWRGDRIYDGIRNTFPNDRSRSRLFEEEKLTRQALAHSSSNYKNTGKSYFFVDSRRAALTGPYHSFLAPQNSQWNVIYKDDFAGTQSSSPVSTNPTLNTSLDKQTGIQKSICSNDNPYAYIRKTENNYHFKDSVIPKINPPINPSSNLPVSTNINIGMANMVCSGSSSSLPVTTVINTVEQNKVNVREIPHSCSSKLPISTNLKSDFQNTIDLKGNSHINLSIKKDKVSKWDNVSTQIISSVSSNLTNSLVTLNVKTGVHNTISPMMNTCVYTHVSEGVYAKPIISNLSDVKNNTLLQPKKIIHLSKCVLYPPNPYDDPPKYRKKPLGCKSVFVIGLPQKVTEEIIREAFEKYGKIDLIQMSKRDYCRVRFYKESDVDNALNLSGYQMKIENKDDDPYTGKLHVDYAFCNDDKRDYQIKLRREGRKIRQKKYEQKYSEHVEPVQPYNNYEGSVVIDKLRNDSTFQQALHILVSWFSRGECNKRTSASFYSMLQSTNRQIKQLTSEKQKYKDDVKKAKLECKQQMQNILIKFNEIQKVFTAACEQKVWDHFTKAQRKNIEVWKKQIEELRNSHIEEVLDDRSEDEMDVSDDDANDLNVKPSHDSTELKNTNLDVKPSSHDSTELKNTNLNIKPSHDSTEQPEDEYHKNLTDKTKFEETIYKLQEENKMLQTQLKILENEKVALRAELAERDMFEEHLLNVNNSLQKNQKKNMLCQKCFKYESELKEYPSKKRSLELEDDQVNKYNSKSESIDSNSEMHVSSTSSAVTADQEKLLKKEDSNLSNEQLKDTSKLKNDNANYSMSVSSSSLTSTITKNSLYKNENFTLATDNIDINKTKNDGFSRDTSVASCESTTNKEHMCIKENLNSGFNRNDFFLESEKNDLDLRAFVKPGSFPNIVDNDALRLGLISTFLHMHPTGADIENICSYLSQIDQSANVDDVENFMKRFPTIFEEEYSIICGVLKKNWTTCRGASRF